MIAVLGLLAAYMLVLKPKDEVIPPSPPSAAAGNLAQGKPAESAAGKLAEKAKEAASTADSRNEQTEEATGTIAKPATKDKAPVAIATKEGVSLAGLPASVRKPLAKDKVLVMLFWNKDSADDRAVRQQLRKVDRWDGLVAVRAASIKNVSKYGRITRGADVAQSPTTLVVDRNLKVTPLVGYFDTQSIDQAAFDALRNSGGYLKNAYLSEVNKACAAAGSSYRMVARPAKFSQLDNWATSGARVSRTMSRRFAGIKAPAKYRGFKRATVRDHKFLVSYYGDWAAFLGKNPTPSRFLAGINKFSGREAEFRKLERRYNNRMDDQHLIACGSNA